MMASQLFGQVGLRSEPQVRKGAREGQIEHLRLGDGNSTYQYISCATLRDGGEQR